MTLSKEQFDIIHAPLKSVSVIACAGSGKTSTAVRRLFRVREQLKMDRGYVALLSFSNVAVSTFRDEFRKHSESTLQKGVFSDRVVIETLDSFITSNILRPHSARVMKSTVTPFLLTGNEPFLENRQFKFWASPRSGNDYPISPRDIQNITFRCSEGAIKAFYNSNGNLFPINNWFEAMSKIASFGGYTHEFGKYWALNTLLDNEALLRALVQRYPHILIDEAQDIDVMHGLFLTVLSDEGVSISLIGDPNQAIYEFAGADGTYLKEFDKSKATSSLPLSKNYRSIQEIVSASSNLSGFKQHSSRAKKNKHTGIYYLLYSRGTERQLVETFVHAVEKNSLSILNSAVLVRSQDLKNKILGSDVSTGQGKTKLLAKATIKRDVDKDFFSAFTLILDCVTTLISDTPVDFKSRIMSGVENDIHHRIKKLIWTFVRCEATGLPSAYLKAKSEWHKLLKKRMATLLDEICEIAGCSKVERLGNKLASTKLPETALFSGELRMSEFDRRMRVDTVHQSKGESLDGVMYVATSAQAKQLIEGTSSELGRIGYVALTRARELFVLAIPENSSAALIHELESNGFQLYE